MQVWCAPLILLYRFALFGKIARVSAVTLFVLFVLVMKVYYFDALRCVSSTSTRQCDVDLLVELLSFVYCQSL